jgi:hypothetical protein
MAANRTSAEVSSITGACDSGGRLFRTCATFAWIWVSAELVVVELEMHGDRAHALGARRLG